MLQTEPTYTPSGCATGGVLSESGRPIPGRMIADLMASMHERSNGLGGGFAGYGIYPEMADHYAFHVMYDRDEYRLPVEQLLGHLRLPRAEPSASTRGRRRASAWRRISGATSCRYLRQPRRRDGGGLRRPPRHAHQPGAAWRLGGLMRQEHGRVQGRRLPRGHRRLLPAGRLQGATCGSAHGRFPTNTVAWWGGAHPFSLLDWTVVHNGEISSYGINRRYVEMFGYQLHPEDRHRSARLPGGPAGAPAQAALEGALRRPGPAVLGSDRAHVATETSASSTGAAPGLRQRHGQRSLQHHHRALRRHDRAGRPRPSCGRWWRRARATCFLLPRRSRPSAAWCHSLRASGRPRRLPGRGLRCRSRRPGARRSGMKNYLLPDYLVTRRR